MSDVTRLLDALRAGDTGANDELIATLYAELRRLAAGQIRHERAQTLDATALVHEAWMRICGPEDTASGAVQGFRNRSHFLGAAAEAMRRILIERARRRRSLKHGGGYARSEVEPDALAALAPSVDLLALDDSLTRLASEAPEKAKIVELRFFAGLSIVEAADVLGVSRATADRHWAIARAWLFRDLRGDEPAQRSSGPR